MSDFLDRPRIRKYLPKRVANLIQKSRTHPLLPDIPSSPPVIPPCHIPTDSISVPALRTEPALTPFASAKLDAPRLALRDISPVTMNTLSPWSQQNGNYNTDQPPHSSPLPTMNGDSTHLPASIDETIANAPSQIQQPHVTTPVRSSGRASVLRRVSGFADLDTSPSNSPSTNGIGVGTSPNGGLSTTHESPSADKTEGENSQPWINAVGGASVGKSGRVIERLMGDIDKLRRELNAQIQHRQEVEKREETSRSTIDSLTAENANLIQAKEVDATMLKRRDRQVEQLKAEVESERSRRIAAEKSVKEITEQKEKLQHETAVELGQAREIARHATGHADVLEQSHKQLGQEYRQRAEIFLRDLRKLETERDEEAQRVKRLDTVVESLESELEKSNRLNAKLVECLEAYKKESEEKLRTLSDEIRVRDEEHHALQEEMERVVGEARWLIAMGRNVIERDARDGNSTAANAAAATTVVNGGGGGGGIGSAS